jgi:uncharacterized protein YjbI with pentapeptide repeats
MLSTKMIGNKIAEARKKTNISQAQLAELLFISPQAVGKWERGESMPDIITFIRLAEILSVDLNYFSDNFQSVDNETASGESLTKQSVQFSSEKPKKKKLSWNMSRGNWQDADFSGLKNLHDKFSSSNMLRCLFVDSDLSGLLLKYNNVDACNFSGSDISNSHIQSSNLLNNLFKGCSLKETEFTTSNINGCDFSGASFNGAKFSKSLIYGCHFAGTDFTGMMIKSGGFSGVASRSNSIEKNTIADAVWNHSSFIDAQIADIVFGGKLEDCYFENCSFTSVTFRNATLINTFFKCKSLKKIKFIDCQADRMTYEFLKNGKADLSGITLLN